MVVRAAVDLLLWKPFALFRSPARLTTCRSGIRCRCMSGNVMLLSCLSILILDAERPKVGMSCLLLGAETCDACACPRNSNNRNANEMQTVWGAFVVSPNRLSQHCHRQASCLCGQGVAPPSARASTMPSAKSLPRGIATFLDASVSRHMASRLYANLAIVLVICTSIGVRCPSSPGRCGRVVPERVVRRPVKVSAPSCRRMCRRSRRNATEVQHRAAHMNCIL